MQTNLFEDLSDRKGKALHLHEEFITIRPVLEEEIAELYYSFQDTAFGEVIVASSKKRIHWIAFANTWREGVVGLNKRFPTIKITEETKAEHQKAASLFDGEYPEKGLSVYPVGTEFQIKVWKMLLKIPKGKTWTFNQVAKKLNLPSAAARAVGTAIGKNPIAYIIPCHRVIQGNGKLAGYRWGLGLKKRILLEELNTK
jgi:AraC family transcriptional regulator, regulatory protein of adaptative response / methylated-DNA-[protein]-cysteine methyltransferase